MKINKSYSKKCWEVKIGKIKDKVDKFVMSRAYSLGVLSLVALYFAGTAYLIFAPKKSKEFDYRSGGMQIEDRMYEWNEKDDKTEVFIGKENTCILVDTNKDGLADYKIKEYDLGPKGKLERKVAYDTNDVQIFKEIINIRDEIKRKGL